MGHMWYTKDKPKENVMSRRTSFTYQDFLGATAVDGLTEAVKTQRLIRRVEQKD